MEEIKEYFKTIELHLMHNYARTSTSKLRTNPAEAVEVIMFHLDAIKNSHTKSNDIIQNSAQSILDVVISDDLREDKDKLFDSIMKLLKWILKSDYDYNLIKDACEALSNLAISDADQELTELNKKWCGKFIFKDGTEDTSYIICPSKFYLIKHSDSVLCDATVVKLATENTNGADPGVSVHEATKIDIVEDYYGSDKDWDDKKSNVANLDRFLSNLNQHYYDLEIVSEEYAKEIITEHLNWYINDALEWTSAYKQSEEDCYDETTQQYTDAFNNAKVYEHMSDVKERCPIALLNKFHSKKQMFKYFKEFTESKLAEDPDYLCRIGPLLMSPTNVPDYKVTDADFRIIDTKFTFGINLYRCPEDKIKDRGVSIMYCENSLILVDDNGEKWLMMWDNYAREAKLVN